ncbi:nif-specific transcriptional activator NifA [Methylocystis echinoides]|uniref:Nif-specific regulatory protein n=1 Tax=Methylocystis echinoides TaxID=29468 RepID=A0A9W6LSY4_9HYPH|nr:nif-specific transcriptional activator NifA [Methylocystis echinoides]GLI94073.1 nif-specific regulatory protein [Methylocystis echinoides]
MGLELGGDIIAAPPRATVSGETALVGIYEISKLLASPARLENVLAGVLTLLSSFLDMRHGLIALLDDKGAPEVVVGSGWSEGAAKVFFERLPERAVGQIIATKMPVVVDDVASSPLFEGVDLSDWGTEDGQSFSMIGVPIKDGDAVVGTLTVDRSRNSRSSMLFDHDVRFLTMIANLVGQTLRLHKLIARDRERLMLESAWREKSDRTVPPEVRAEGLKGIVGNSPAVRAVVDKIRIVAKSKATVLLRGESGTGKELFAAAIHDQSPRRNQPFVKLNCAALPESVLESELFGHERGAFTGAANLRKGRFELAHGGTLFLDEIGEITPAFQAKLLRVLQEGEFERVGGARTIKVDVRIVCATNKDLEQSVQRGEFRADLYYRISVVPIFLPPLRDRKGDLGLLANEFLRRYNDEQGVKLKLSESALGVLNECGFPGNIRELENCINRTATLANGEVIVDKDFSCRKDGCLSAILWGGTSSKWPGNVTPLPIVAPQPAPPAPPAQSGPAPEEESFAPPGAGETCPGAVNCKVIDKDPRTDYEKLVEAMERAGWVKAKAARLLGLTPRQIGYALQKHGIMVKKF